MPTIDTPITSLTEPWENHRGQHIEELLKRELLARAGDFYYDPTNNRYLVFTSAEARTAYLADPEANSSLLLGTFDAPFNYTAEINLLTPSYIPLLIGSTGNYIDFTFDIKNKSGQSTGEDVICTFTFTRASVKKTVTQKYRSGTRVHFGIDSYLDSGTTLVTIGISGVSSLAATTVGVTCQVVDLTLTDEFDISAVHSPGDSLEIPYSISGFGAKVMEWYLDGQLLDTVPAEDTITEVSTTRIKYIPLGQLPAGTHSIQFRAYTVVNGEKFYSQTAYRDFMVHTADNRNNLAAVAFDLPLDTDPLTDGQARLYGITQYEPYNLRIAIFNPSYAASTPVEIHVNDNDTALAVLSMSNNTVVDYSLVLTTPGSTTITLVADGITYTIPATVEATSTSLEEITQGLVLDLRAIGKSNESADRDHWTYKEFSTAFNGFLWTERSGWAGNRLNMSNGAGITVKYNPLRSDAPVYGKTLEFEFSTSDVKDNDAVICDIRQGSTGLLITASEASLISATGAKVSTKYKSGENIRLTFVINRRAGVANKCLAFLYVNGVLSGAVNFPSNDNFLVTGDSFSINSSEDVAIALKSLRFYDTALSSNQVLNNYALYRDTAAGMMEVYDRNDIYTEGTTDFSTEILSGQLPVMIITGNIPALESTNDKKLQIDVDVEYINLQDPARSFTIKNGAMTPQGTSSMSYPKKNFKLYTTKKDNTVLHDADGNVVANKLYSFKEGAQPVDCWCLKADYAESSGTHNTGVARIWNDVMKNAVIDGEYKLRTRAQQAAIDSKYPYDVRTTVDGFPCVLFYRLDENSPLVFIGKYNFNNDKSTESVFGFKDIPGFDNSKMQCWELLNNGHHLGLFNDTTNWNSEWADAFEGRYPDGNTDTTDLKAFAIWMSTVKESDFTAQKWDHFDVYKMAAYYVYLMRFGAVDQVVKNSMLTSEDGSHWFFINYDNDTIFGVRNDGLLIYPPTIDRQTLDTTFSSEVYAYAGHDSRLWNLLEADGEFMRIVLDVDQALYVAGLSYDGVVNMFDGQQADKWCERIYNQDAEYKYIGPFTDRGVNNLFMLQGSRSAYRRWWVSERFALYDAKYVSGEYKANSVELKLAGAPAGLDFEITAGRDFSYGYGVNNIPIEYGVDLKKGEIATLTTKSVLNVGDPVRIYAGPYIKSLMLSHLAPYLAQINLAPANSGRLGTCLESLILWSNNTSLSELSGISQCTALRYLDIRHFKALTSLDLSSNINLNDLRATESGLTSVILPKNAPLENVWLPGSLQFFRLDSISTELPLLATCNIQALPNDGIEKGLFIEGKGCNITGVEILNCPNFDSKTFVLNWLTAKLAEDSLCTLTLEGINWTGLDADVLIRIGRRFREVSLKGVIAVSSVTPEQVTALQEIYGNNCFSPQAELFISAPGGAYIIGPSTIRDLVSAQFSYAVFGTSVRSAMWSIVGRVPANISFTSDGLLKVGAITVSSTFTVRCTLATEQGIITAESTVTAIPEVYPTADNTTIEGPAEINAKGRYTYRLVFSESVSDRRTTEWVITDGGKGVVSIVEEGKDFVTFDVTTDSTEVIDGVIGMEVSSLRLDGIKTLRDMAVNIPFMLNVVGNVIMTSNSNPKVLAICYKQGWCASPNYMTDMEAAMVTDIGDAFNPSASAEYSQLRDDDNLSFHEFQYFISVQSINSGAVQFFKEITFPFGTYESVIEAGIWTYKNQNPGDNRIYKAYFPFLESFRYSDTASGYRGSIRGYDHVEIPKIRSISDSMFYNSLIKTIYAPEVTEIHQYAFYNSSIQEVTLETFPKLEAIEPYYTFAKSALQSIELASSVRIATIEGIVEPGDMFRNCSQLQSVNLPSLMAIGPYMFYSCEKLTEVILPKVQVLYEYGFAYCESLTEISLPSLVTLKSLKSLFYRCWDLTNINWPALKEITYSGSMCETFYGCTSLKYLEFPEVTRISLPYASTAGYLFYGSSIEEIKAPKLVEMSANLFMNAYTLKKVSMPLMNEIPYGCFANCNSLIEIDAPNIQTIGDAGIFACISLPSVPVTEVTSFGVEALRSCSNLKSITFGRSLTSIDRQAFLNCTNLETLFFTSPKSPSCSTASIFGNSSDTERTGSLVKGEKIAYFPEGSNEEYDPSNHPWSELVDLGYEFSYTL